MKRSCRSRKYSCPSAALTLHLTALCPSCLVHVENQQCGYTRESKGYLRLEVAGSDDLLRSKDSEEDRNDFVRRIIVVRLEVAFVFFFQGFPVQAVNQQGFQERELENSGLVHVEIKF